MEWEQPVRGGSMRRSRIRCTSGALALVSVVAACGSLVGPEDVRIRVRNASAFDIESVLVDFPSGREDYGGVPAGTTTGYRVVDTAADRLRRRDAAGSGRLYLRAEHRYAGRSVRARAVGGLSDARRPRATASGRVQFAGAARVRVRRSRGTWEPSAAAFERVPRQSARMNASSSSALASASRSPSSIRRRT